MNISSDIECVYTLNIRLERSKGLKRVRGRLNKYEPENTHCLFQGFFLGETLFISINKEDLRTGLLIFSSQTL
jgi:hypothetical protein